MNRRVDMFCLADNAAVVNVWMREEVMHDQGDSFTVACSPTGEAPITHYAASGVLNDQQWADFTNEPPAELSWYRCDSTRARTLRETTSDTPNILNTSWTWAKTLQDMGLQQVS